MMKPGQQVRVRNGIHAGEDGVVIDVEQCSRKTATGWQPCSFWYVQFASCKTSIEAYEEEALEVVAQQPARALSVSA